MRRIKVRQSHNAYAWMQHDTNALRFWRIRSRGVKRLLSFVAQWI